jgi:hypothetical protein
MRKRGRSLARQAGGLRYNPFLIFQTGSKLYETA